LKRTIGVPDGIQESGSRENNGKLIKRCADTDERVKMKLEIRMRVDNNGRILFPARLRQALDIKAGDMLVLRLEDGERIMTLQRRIELAQETVRKYVNLGISLADELIADRRADAIREQD
jgi:AbrB family looped-hinge helix DNA binding protein